MNDLQSLQSLGFTWPSPAYIFGAVIFGLIGWAAWRYGKKTERPRTKWLGVALMFYPYVVTQTVWMYIVGIVLCGVIFYDRG